MNIFRIILQEPLANGLIMFYNLFGGSLGLAIISFSVFLRIILNPLTAPYMNSMSKMRELAPQLDKLKKRHKGDKMKLAKAQADLYKEKGVNPGAGCIPYLLQIVVLIAFFNVFNITLKPDGDPTASFNEFLYPSLKFEENVKVNTEFLYLDLTKPDVIKLDFLPFPLPGPILILAALAQFITSKIMSPLVSAEEKVAKKTKEQSDDIQVAMQKSMTYTFPLFTLIIGLQFASGLALYWFVFSLTQTYQQVKTQGWGGLTPTIDKLKLQR
jgi:YidC/Oxa1 family membrane protein insertase